MSVAIRTINDHDPQLEPTKYNVNKSDLYSDSSGRSAESGDMILYLVRKNVYSIELEFIGTASQIQYIQSLLTGSDFSVVFLDETYTSPDTSSYVTRYMYASDRKIELLGTPNSRKYRLSFNLIETRGSD